jgi:hypothetical protein
MSTTTHTVPTLSATRPTRKRIGGAGYWIAAVLALAGIAAAIAWAGVRTLETIGRADDFPRAVIPGTVTAKAMEPGKLVVYYEGKGKPTPRALGLTVSGPGGDRVVVQPYELELQYDAPGDRGVANAVASFQANATGMYRVSATSAPQPGARIAVGEDLGRGLLSRLAWPGAVALSALIVASALAAWTHRRRRP